MSGGNKRKPWKNRLVFLVAALSVYLSLVNLGNVSFWDDEVETAWMSRSLVEQGSVSAWNGRNIHDYGKGLYLDERLQSRFPPLTFFTGFLSFKIFGISEGGGRALFALMGVACLGVFLLVLRLEMPGDRNGSLRLAAFSIFSLSPVYLLHIRQMRYFAPALLLTVLTFYLYRLYIKKHRPQNLFPWSVWAMALCAGLLFLTHFLLAISFIAALGLCHLAFHARLKKPEWHLWLALTTLLCVFAAHLVNTEYIVVKSVIPPDISVRANVFSVFYQEDSRLVRISSLLPLYLRFINIGGLAPWFVVLWFVWIAAKRAARRKTERDETENTVVFYGSVALLIVAVCAVFSPQQEYDQYAATRFFFTAFPFFAVVTATFCLKLLSRSRAAGIALVFLILNTTFVTWPFGIQNSPPLGRPYKLRDLPMPVRESLNIFSLRSTYTEWTLPGMIAEFHREYPTFIEGLTEFFEKNGEQDEIMAINPTWAFYNSMWYLDKKFLFCCMYNSKSYHLPPEVLRKYKVELRPSDKYRPDWMVFFGPARRKLPGRILAMESIRGDTPPGTIFRFGSGRSAKTFVLVKKLNKFYFPSWRPELYWHSFSPVNISEDPRLGDVFIFRRIKS